MVEEQMPKKRISLLMLILVVLSIVNCATTTMIKTIPEGADIFLQGDLMGKTPWKLEDNYSLPEEVTIRLEREGYVPLEVRLEKETSYILGVISLVPYPPFPLSYFWTWKFDKSYSFKLTPKKEPTPGEKPGPEKTPPPEQK
jgi:hypothetical protein